MRVNEVAAAIHRRMCEDDRFGYSWEERFGAFWETWEVGGRRCRLKVGDYDCSSSCITAWAVALQGTAFEGALDGAITTHNMSEVFVGSGLFERRPISFIASPGDLYLNDGCHVAMCQTQVPDVLSEFSWGDNGAYGNVRGDQSGWEAHVCGYYDYPWDCVLHYTGAADAGGSGSSSRAAASPSPAETSGKPVMPRYRVAIKVDGKKKWLPWMEGLRDTGGSSDTFAGVPGSAIVDVQFKGGTLGPKGWFKKKMKGGKLIGLTVFYDTPEPGKTGYYEAVYRVHWLGASPGWGKWEHDDLDGGAGNDRDVVDMVEVTIAKV